MSFDNIDKQTVQGFGQEWNVFDQSNLSDSERNFLLIFTLAISMVKTSSLCGWF